MTPQQLKNSILQLAIQGKLVEQRSEEGTGQDLFNQIQEERQKLIVEGKIKNEKALAPISDEELSFDIPDSWQWARMSMILDVRDGTHDSPKYISSGIPLVTSKNLSNGTIDFSNIKFISEDIANKINLRSNVDDGDILFAMIGTIGNPVLVKKERNFCIKNVALFKNFSQTLFTQYVYWFLCYVQYYLRKQASGGVQSFVSLNMLRNTLIPLPPLEEQKRIVAKIEELLSYVDKYQEYYDELESLKSKFPGQLRKSILQYAIEGKLVEQRPEEGTGQDLFNQIQEEKQKLIAEGKIKKEKALAPITEDEIPFDIPESWRWCRLVSLFQFINGDRGKNYPSKDKLKTKGIPFISAINLKDGKILHDEKLMCLSNEQYDLLSSGKLQKNDIVICIRGSLGKHAVFTEEQGAIASSLVILRQPKKLNSMVSYVSYFIDSKLFFDEISQTDNGTAQPNLSSKNLENFIFPLPPLAEQKRIVSKVEELFALCDKLDLS